MRERFPFGVFEKNAYLCYGIKGGMRFQVFIIVLFGIVLAACSPQAAFLDPTPSAAPTRMPTTTLTGVPTATRTFMPPAPSVTPTSTDLPPTETVIPEGCYQAELVEDVTVLDGSVIAPGEIFLKIWRVQNTGSCTWRWGDLWLSFDDEHPLNGPDQARAYFYPPDPVLELALIGNAAWQNFLGEVSPGEIVDLPLLLQAPDTPGVYRSHWRFESESGTEMALLWVLMVVNQEKPFQQPDWSGVWLHSNTWFLNGLVDPGMLVVEQQDGEIFGFFYPHGGPSNGDLVYLTGTIGGEGRQVEGIFNMLWDAPMEFQWSMRANQHQFEGEIFPRQQGAAGTWCGGRNGRVPPVCAP